MALIMAILSNEWKPDNFEPHNNNFAECETFLESNYPDISALCETNLDDSLDSGNFSVRGYLCFIWKDSITHMYSLAACGRQVIHLAKNLPLENSAYF